MRVCVGVSVCMKACSVNVCVCVLDGEGSGVLASSALVHVVV